MVRLWVAISLLIITSPFLKTTKAFSQSWASPVDPALEVTPDQEPDRKLTYSVQGGTGFGVFQDIQVPFAPTSDRRADGSSATSELQDHFGFLLFGAVGRSWTLGSTDIDLAIKALLVRATLGPVETQTSSYSRFELATGADLLSVGDYNPTTLGFLTSLRRSNYLNISTGSLFGNRCGRPSADNSVYRSVDDCKSGIICTFSTLRLFKRSVIQR